MKRSKEEPELITPLEAIEDLINEPFTCVPGMLLFGAEKQREVHAQTRVFYQAQFDEAARALAMILVKRQRKKKAARSALDARATAKGAAVPPVTTVAVPETPPSPKLQSRSGT